MWYREWITLLVVITAFVYVAGPLVILFTFKLRSPTRIVFFDPKAVQVPGDVAKFMKRASQQLIACGFEPVENFFLPELVANAKSINVLFENTAASEAAMANCIYIGLQGRPPKIKASYVEFVARFRDGVCVLTNNSRQMSGFRHPPDDHTIQFWDLEDIAELYRRHRKICAQLSTARKQLRLTEDFGGDVEQFIQTAVIKESADYQVEAGLFRRVSDGYAPTIRGAFILTWQELFPWKQLRKMARRREAERWLEEIGSV